MKHISLLLLVLVLSLFLIVSACDEDTTNVYNEPLVPGTCSPAPVVSASVSDLIVGDGLGDVVATDTTEGAVSWHWSLVNCQPSSGSGSTFSTVCPLGSIRWTVEVCNESCCDSASNTTPVS